MKETEKSQRDTRQRRMVLEEVLRRSDHPNADDVYQNVRAQDSRISKATVYRNLKVLSESGEIRHVKVPGADRFDHTTKNHDHILCTQCGTVIDAPLDYSAEDDAFVGEQTGFHITRHRTVYEGLCPSCLKNRK